MNHAHRILPEIKQWIEKWKNTSCPDDSLVDKSLTRCHPGTLLAEQLYSSQLISIVH